MARDVERNAEERRRDARQGRKRKPPPLPPPPVAPRPQASRPFQRFLLWLGGGIFTVAGIIFGVWLAANYAADLEYVIEPGKGPDMRWAAKPEVHGQYKTELVEVRFKVRNVGLKEGALERCEVAPLGVHELPKVEVTYIDRRSISRGETALRMIQFRYVVAAVHAVARDIISWRIDCYDTAGTYVGGLKAAAVLRKGDEPEPIPYNLLRSPKVDD